MIRQCFGYQNVFMYSMRAFLSLADKFEPYVIPSSSMKSGALLRFKNQPLNIPQRIGAHAAEFRRL
jgi:hypothetical protein